MALQHSITYKGLPVPAAYIVIDSYQVSTVLREIQELVRVPNPEYMEGVSPPPVNPFNEYMRTLTKKVYIVDLVAVVYTDASKGFSLESRKHRFEYTAQADITFSGLYRSILELQEYAGARDV